MKRKPTVLSRAREGPGTIDAGFDYSAEELAWLRAVDAYKAKNRRPFPHLTELLAILKAMGYSK